MALNFQSQVFQDSSNEEIDIKPFTIYSTTEIDINPEQEIITYDNPVLKNDDLTLINNQSPNPTLSPNPVNTSNTDLSTPIKSVNERKKYTSLKYCRVIGCSSKNRHSRFTCLPSDPNLQKIWYRLCGYPSTFKITSKHNFRVCFRHFPEELHHDMRCKVLKAINDNHSCRCKLLQQDPNAVPSLFLPGGKQINKGIELSKKKRKERFEKRENKKIVEELLKKASEEERKEKEKKEEDERKLRQQKEAFIEAARSNVIDSNTTVVKVEATHDDSVPSVYRYTPQNISLPPLVATSQNNGHDDSSPSIYRYTPQNISLSPLVGTSQNNGASQFVIDNVNKGEQDLEMFSESEPDLTDTESRNNDPDYVPYSPEMQIHVDPQDFLQDPTLEYIPATVTSAVVDTPPVNPTLNLCRICAFTCPDMIHVFSERGRHLELQQKISLCLPIQLHEDDTLPLNVCMICVQRLEDSFSLTKTCKQADGILRSMLGLPQQPTVSNQVSPDKRLNYNSQGQSTSEHHSTSPVTDVNLTSEQSSRNTFTCSHCNHKFNDKATLTNHLITKHKKNCQLCKYYTFSNDIKELDNHFVKHHINNTEQIIFDSKFIELKMLEENVKARNKNIKIHKKIKPIINIEREYDFPCKNCNLTFKYKLELKSHYEISHSLYLCHKNQCFDLFHTNNQLEAHLKCHTATCHVKLCPYCGKSLKSQQNLEDHIDYEHENQPDKYECNICDKKYKAMSSLKSHKKRHEISNNKDEFICFYCGKIFKSKNNIKIHIKNVHGIKKYKCKQCKKLFIDRKCLDVHIEKLHSNSWIYHCRMCDTGYRNIKSLREHYNAHSSIEKRKIKDKTIYYKTSKYQCVICLEYFQNKNKFKVHLKPLHGISESEYYQDLQGNF